MNYLGGEYGEEDDVADEKDAGEEDDESVDEQ